MRIGILGSGLMGAKPGRTRAKRVAVCLIRDIGFEPVDAGPLRIARTMEPCTLLIAQLAYEIGRGPELSYRLDWRRK